MSELQEQIAQELFWRDLDKEYIADEVMSGNWDEFKQYIKDSYLKESFGILFRVYRHIEGIEVEYEGLPTKQTILDSLYIIEGQGDTYFDW